MHSRLRWDSQRGRGTGRTPNTGDLPNDISLGKTRSLSCLWFLVSSWSAFDDDCTEEKNSEAQQHQISKHQCFYSDRGHLQHQCHPPRLSLLQRFRRLQPTDQKERNSFIAFELQYNDPFVSHTLCLPGIDSAQSSEQVSKYLYSLMLIINDGCDKKEKKIFHSAVVN